MYKTEDISLRYSTVVKDEGPGVRLSRLNSQLQLLFIWTSYVASVSLSFCICEVGMIMALNGTAVRIKLDITDVKHLAP